ncbi:hypothetical protein LPJ53_003387 [Coemansia erecta]|uniref:Uncharacterized protein n=1 Tax=Coemansia erecta TaxID=147472 RepID=A0A9W7XZC3_9FUNG|nr:hypothetical protein LPJ53_003387 [Coemansia erecta]
MLIDDLDDAILDRIFAIAQSTAASHSPRLRTYKHLLALAAVSRRWRRLMHTYLHSTVIMEYRPKRVAAGLIAAAAAAGSATNGHSADKRKRSIGSGMWSSRAYIRKPKANGSATSPQQQQQHRDTARRAAEWASNISVLALQATQPMLATKLRIQAFVDSADYALLIDAMRSDGFEQHKWTNVSTIEFVDFAAVPTPSAQQQQQQQLQQVLQTASALEPSYAGVTRLLAEHMPGVEDISSSTWDISAASRCLATHLVRQYGAALRVWNVQTMASGISAGQPKIGSSLTALHIQAAQLQLLGKASVPAAQLQNLTLSHAPPFFSWQPFASSSNEPKKLEFTSLTALTIDYEKDNVANDTHRDDATRSSKSPHVTMGVDPRHIAFPRLAALTVRRVPYTYTSAWSMFLGAPLKKLQVAGKHAHVRYLDVRLLKNIDCVDLHLYLSTHAQGKFTSLVKTLLAAESDMRSAWLRHSEVFPLSVPQTAGWTNLRELNITAYIPPSALLNLVSQLPKLHVLVAQRIARDASEALLDDSTFVELAYLKPKTVSSTSVRHLQLHMAGTGLRVTSLQSICYVLLSMPNVTRLAVKQGYFSRIHELVRVHAKEYPQMLTLELVDHISMQMKPALTL